MEKSRSKGYGVRGWILIIWIATALMSYLVVGNFSLNILSDLYGGQQTLSTIYTVASVIGIIIQLAISGFVGKMKSIKLLSTIMGVLVIVVVLGIMFIPGYVPGTMQKLWQVVYGVGTVISVMYGTFALSILVGRWFPTKKGGAMGIATCAFPITNGLIGPFAAAVFKDGGLHIAQAFTPFLIVLIIGLIIGIAFVPDYPEQVGAYRDNDKNMTPEIAKAMMEQDIENAKTTVWTIKHTFATRDFWLLTIPSGLMLAFSAGLMTQSNAILGQMGDGILKFGGFSGVMAMVMIFGLIGSVVLGFLDQKFGTKKAMILGCILMFLAGIFGAVSSPERAGLLVLSIVFIALFMGASSNFTVSLAAQYWRKEDFGSVFATVNPIANLLCAFGPMVIAMVMIAKGYNMIFVVTAVLGALSIVMACCFSGKHVKEKDDKYRASAGKPLDDALVGRK